MELIDALTKFVQGFSRLLLSIEKLMKCEHATSRARGIEATFEVLPHLLWITLAGEKARCCRTCIDSKESSSLLCMLIPSQLFS
jgi:hypothetical protein